MYSLSNKTVLITGATGHLGEALSRGLAELGAHVLVNSRNEEQCARLVAKIESEGNMASSACFDVTSVDSIRNFASRLKRLDVLINNAYSGRKHGTLGTSPVEDYVDSYRSSVAAAGAMMAHLQPNLMLGVEAGGDASVINIASMYGLVSPDFRVYEDREAGNPPFYGANKAAIIQLTRYAACTMGEQGIRVNSVSPGAFPSEQVLKVQPELAASLEAKVPLGRLGLRQEIVGPCAFLASNASTYVNGANLVVDGGWTAW